jgi:hypothetical protein
VDRFSAVLGGEEGERPTVVLPFDAKQRYGKARAQVRGTVNGAAFRTTVAVYSGLHLIGFNKEVRERAGVEIGDDVTVELEQALATNSEARAAVDGLSYTHRREYAEWIGEGKRPDTRQRRAARALEMLESGRRHP